MSLFQKRHYEAIAAIFRRLAPKPREAPAKGLVEDFADMFQHDNPNFNRDRFIKAVYEKSS